MFQNFYKKKLGEREMMMMIPAKNSPTPAAHQDPRELCKDSGYLYEAVMSTPRQGQCRKLSWKCRDVGTLNSLSYYMNTCTPPHACTFVCARTCACAHTHIPDTESFLYARQRSASTLPLHALSNLKYSLNNVFKIRTLRLRKVRSLIMSH